MGLLDRFRGKKEEPEEEPEPEGRFNEECALCGGTGTDKKWAGQFWHKKCLRQAKKVSKKMI
ncbi:MAG: hypothetical protein V1672_00155 [Candidatus Diapherotrites archaeon]